MGNNTPILSIHVPKCAGTSLARLWAQFFGSQNVALYYEDRGLFNAASEENVLNGLPISLRNTLLRFNGGRRLYTEFIRPYRLETYSIDEIPKNIEVVHGHFTYDLFDKVYPGAIKTTVIRNPLGRMYSHLNYWKELYKQNFRLPSWFNPRMPFEEFAFHDEMINYMSLYTGKDPDEYDLVGRLEDFPRYLNELSELIGYEGEFPQIRVNVGKEGMQEDKYDEGFVREFVSAHQADYHFYDSVLKAETKRELKSEFMNGKLMR